MSDGSKDTEYKFKRWKPTIWDYVCKFILSEAFAWAVQNAIGVLFTVLFSLVWPMTFTLACVSSALYAAGSQVLSLDRTVGGRLFAASIFVGCMLSGGVIGGSLSSLAWVAHGSSQGLYHYFNKALENPMLQEIPAVRNFTDEQLRTILGEGLALFADVEKISFLPVPAFVEEAGSEWFSEFAALFPPIKDGFWILLMVLFAIFSIPFCIARAHKNLKVGVLMAISTLFMGSQVIFATLMPTLGLREYWTQITSGYIKVALVSGGAMVCTALIAFVKPSHDTAREQIGNVFKHTGLLLSGIASTMSTPVELPLKGNAMEEKPLEEIQKSFSAEVHMLANLEVSVHKPKYFFWYDNDEESGNGRWQLPSARSALQLRANCKPIEDTLAVCLFEMPIPQVCSQPGARRLDYVNLLQSLQNVLSTMSCIETVYMDAREELSILESAEIQSNISFLLAAIAAILAQAEDVICRMDLFKPCYGSQINWKPKSEEFWEDLDKRVTLSFENLTKSINSEELCISCDSRVIPSVFTRGRAAILLLMDCHELIWKSRKAEQLLAVALQVPLPGSAEVQKDSTEASKEEARKQGLKEKILGNAYLPAILIHTILLSGLGVFLLLVLGTKSLVSGTVKFLSSKEARRQILRDRYVQFAFKYWLSLSLTVMGIVLILWKAKASSGNQLLDAYNLTYFFFVWQPIYFWITAAICIQFQVEAAAFRAVLRTTMTAVGGTLGWFTMMNGYLANNPYFIASITSLFNGVCGLFSPVKSIRYSLFLVAFTFNAVVICQYFGCCDLAGDTEIYGGKVLSTLLGSIYSIIVSWCILPYYTSQRMLGLESQALQDTHGLIEEMYATLVQQGCVTDETNKTPIESHIPIQPDEAKSRSASWLEQIEKSFDEPLTAIHKEMELNTVDRKQFLLLTWTILPTPQIVPLVMSRLEVLSNYLREAANLFETEVLSGDCCNRQASLLKHIAHTVDHVFETSDSVIQKCQVTMEASSKTALQLDRVTLCSSLTNLSNARAALRVSFAEWERNNSTKEWKPGELKFLSICQLLLLSIREIEVIGLLLGETEASLDRDRWFSWAASWFGRRPF